MISINKDGSRPDILYKKGNKIGRDKLEGETIALMAYYIKYKNDIDTGAKKFKFDNKLYAHPKIKTALINLQSGKCCFCESKVLHVSDGDIEHFRPKAAYKQLNSDKLIRPGYFWLTYDWDNLFLACLKCNQRNKGNMFPLIDDSQRAQYQNFDLQKEEPYFIHPQFDVPEEHIDFEGAFIKPKNKSIRGKNTILELNLERNALYDTRKEKYDIVKAMIGLYQISPMSHDELNITKQDVKDLLNKFISSKSEYSGMIKANFYSTINKILNEE